MPAPDLPVESLALEKPDGQFDPFMGDDGGALAGTQQQKPSKDAKEDDEADAIWAMVDKRMDERRKEKREENERKEAVKRRELIPNISEQFSDLKRELAAVDESAWENIPDIGDYTAKRRKEERFVPVPDNMLARAADSMQKMQSIDGASGTESVQGGVCGGVGGGRQDLTAVGEGRSAVVQLKLDSMSDSVSGQTVVDPKGYLTDLQSVTLKSDAEISDIKKARLLLKSVINTNPKHAPGWIAAARLEEVAGKLQDARAMVLKGCELCPGSEDVWLEASRLQKGEDAKGVLARGVAALPKSVNIWMRAANLETDDNSKKRILLRALERVPESVRLWKAVVDISDENDARILLSRAVECCPQHVELWLALAKLETYKNAQKILNRARKTIPTSADVWITAAKLEESQGNEAAPSKIIPRAIKSLESNGVVIDRQWWMKAAEVAERSDPPMTSTCRAIIATVIGVDVEEEDKKRTWVADAEECVKNGSIETARAIYAQAMEAFPTRKGVWRRAAVMEKQHGSVDNMLKILEKGVELNPQAVILYLMAAKEKWVMGDLDAARSILEDAFRKNPESEDIWLAAFKVEFEGGEMERERVVLERARRGGQAASERLWIKSALLERADGQVDAQRRLLQEGISKFPKAWKLHLMAGFLEQIQGNLDGARAAYTLGTRHCPRNPQIWIALAALEENQGRVSKARAILEKGRLTCNDPVLWRESFRLEHRHKTASADSIMAAAFQHHPDSGILHAEWLRTAPRTARKSRSIEALKRLPNDANVVLAVAQMFLADRKRDKALSWLQRAVTLDPDNGDAWGALYMLQSEHGTPDEAAKVVADCVAAEPHHGEVRSNPPPRSPITRLSLAYLSPTSHPTARTSPRSGNASPSRRFRHVPSQIFSPTSQPNFDCNKIVSGVSSGPYGAHRRQCRVPTSKTCRRSSLFKIPRPRTRMRFSTKNSTTSSNVTFPSSRRPP